MAMKKTRVALAVAQACGALAFAAATSVVMVPSAFAQSAEGSVYGTGKPGAQVTLTNTETGAVRQGTVDSAGSFALTKVAPGSYKVTSAGVTREISVSIGSGTRVSLSAEAAQRVEVTGTRTRSTIDVSSTESNSVFTAEQLRALPVARDISAVAALAPGVVKGDGDFTDDSEDAGGLPSFGGASVAENGYYINGFDVTNIRNFLSYATIPFDAIAEQQVKMGGYSVEFGRSLGGVISLATKRGTNTWKGGASVYWEPKSLNAKGQNVLDKEPTNPGGYFLFRADDTVDKLSYNIYGGGPIIQNKLFVFGLVEFKNNETNNFGQSISTIEKSDKPNGMIKIDFTPIDGHSFEYTGIDNKKSVSISDYTNATQYSTSNDGVPGKSKRVSGGTVHIGKYTGALTDDLTISALVGKVDHLRSKTTGFQVAALQCPTVYEMPGITKTGCWNEPFSSSAWKDPTAPDDRDVRKAYRLDVDYVLGQHTLRAGLDNQTFETSEAGGVFSGGIYYRYVTTTGSPVNGVAMPAGSEYVRSRYIASTSGEYKVKNEAYYIEDTWKVRKDLTLVGGLRWESFNNQNGDGVSFAKADNLVAPRIGAAWDVNGDSSMKLYANAGRYYIPVASNTNVRATRGEEWVDKYYFYSARDPVTKAPVLTTQIGGTVILGDGSLPDPATISDTKLKPMSHDELILGIQKAVAPGWFAGAKFTHRKINNGMDDWCAPVAIMNYLNANGYPNHDYHSAAGCMLVNPGNDVNLKADVNDDGNLVAVTIPAAATGLAKYKRTYDAIELSLDKPFDGKWGVSASYTYAKSKGTAEGYVNSIINQDDAGVTQEFDFGSFTHGADGYLPNDRTHQIKIFGTMAVTEVFRVGGNFSLSSGRPKSCIGFVPRTVSDWGLNASGSDGAGAYPSASSFYCLNDQGVTYLAGRGNAGRTPWLYSLDVQLAYTPKLENKQKLTLQADIFNVFNHQGVVEEYEIRDYSRATSITAPGQLNQNYGSPSSFQGPRAVRLSARWEF